MGHLSPACGFPRHRCRTTTRLYQWFLIAAVALALLYYLPAYHLLLAGVHNLSKTLFPGAHRTPLSPSPFVRNMNAQLLEHMKDEPTRNEKKPRTKPMAAGLPKAQPKALRCVIAGPFPGLDLKQVASGLTGTGGEEHSLVVLLRLFARHLPAATESRLVVLVEELPLLSPQPPPPEALPPPSSPFAAPLPPRPPPAPPQKQPSGALEPPPPQSRSLSPSDQQKQPPSALPPDRKPEPAAHSEEQPPPPPPPPKPAREQSGVQNREHSGRDRFRAPNEEQQASRTGGEHRRADESSPQQQLQHVQKENAPLRADRKQPATDRDQHVDFGGAQEAENSDEQHAATELNSERQRSIKRTGSAQKVKVEQTRAVEDEPKAQRNLEERKRPKFNSRNDREGAPQETGDASLQKHVRVRREAHQGEHPLAMDAAQPNVLLQKRQVPPGNEVEEHWKNSNVHTKPQVISKESPEQITSAAIVSRAVAQLLRSFPSDRANVQVMEVELGQSSTQAIRRMKAVLKYLQSDAGQQCQEVLVSDRIDIAFQADPFAAARSTAGTGPKRSPAAIAAPFQPAATGQLTGLPQQAAVNVSRQYLTFAEKANFVGGDGRVATAITECLGDRVLQIISSNRDTVAGFVVGTRAPVHAYTQLVLHLLGLYSTV